MVADTRLQFAQPLRAALATALLPVQRTLNVPVQMWQAGGDYLRGLSGALASEKAAQAKLALQAEKAASADRLALENTRLRALLELRPMLQVRSVPAEVLYEAADPFSRKLFIDRGTTQGVVLGAPVVGAGRRARPGDAGLSAERAGHAADRQGRRDSGAERAHAGAQRGFRRCRRRRDGAALHGGECRCAGGRRAHHQRRRRRLPAGAAGGARGGGGAARRIRLCPHPAGAQRVVRRRAPCAGARADGRGNCRRARKRCPSPNSPHGRPKGHADESADGRAPRGQALDDMRRHREGAAHDHAARLEPAAAAGQPVLHRADAVAGAGREPAAAGPPPGAARHAGAGAGVLERAPAAPRRRRRGLRLRAC